MESVANVCREWSGEIGQWRVFRKKKSKARVRGGGVEKKRSFDVTIGFRQGCAMSPWLFKLVINESYKRIKGRNI